MHLAFPPIRFALDLGIARVGTVRERVDDPSLRATLLDGPVEAQGHRHVVMRHGCGEATDVVEASDVRRAVEDHFRLKLGQARRRACRLRQVQAVTPRKAGNPMSRKPRPLPDLFPHKAASAKD